MSTREKKKAEARKEARKNGPVRASLTNVRMSARKAGIVAKTIRGRNVEDALTMLSFERKRAAEPLRKLLDSAVANADERGLDLDRLVVSHLVVEKGPIMRRFQPRAHGRANRIRKQSSHFRVELTEASSDEG